MRSEETAAPQKEKDGERPPEPAMAVIRAGEFLMGSREDRDEERPVHRVWVDGFEMAIYQVRNRDYIAVCSANRPLAAASGRRAGFLPAGSAGGFSQLV